MGRRVYPLRRKGQRCMFFRRGDADTPAIAVVSEVVHRAKWAQRRVPTYGVILPTGYRNAVLEPELVPVAGKDVERLKSALAAFRPKPVAPRLFLPRKAQNRR